MTSIFAKHLETLPDDCLVIAPDAGAAQRAQSVATALGLAAPIVMNKTRTDQGITHQPVSQPLTQHVLVVDDILDTGDTLVSCCRQLASQGVVQFILVVTHGVFSSDRWQQLWELGMEKMYVSDSIPGLGMSDHRVLVCPTQIGL